MSNLPKNVIFFTLTLQENIPFILTTNPIYALAIHSKEWSWSILHIGFTHFIMRLMVKLEWSKNHISMWVMTKSMTPFSCIFAYYFIGYLLVKVQGLMNIRYFQTCVLTNSKAPRACFFVVRYFGLMDGCMMRWKFFGTSHGKGKCMFRHCSQFYLCLYMNQEFWLIKFCH
jgi:hypothetical protein